MGAAAAGLAVAGALGLGLGLGAAADLAVADALAAAGALAVVRRLAAGLDAEAVFAPVDTFFGADEDAAADLVAGALRGLADFFAAAFAVLPAGVALRLSALESLCVRVAGALVVLRLDVGVSGCMRAPFRITSERPWLTCPCRPLIA